MILIRCCQSEQNVFIYIKRQAEHVFPSYDEKVDSCSRDLTDGRKTFKSKSIVQWNLHWSGMNESATLLVTMLVVFRTSIKSLNKGDCTVKSVASSINWVRLLCSFILIAPVIRISATLVLKILSKISLILLK